MTVHKRGDDAAYASYFDIPGVKTSVVSEAFGLTGIFIRSWIVECTHRPGAYHLFADVRDHAAGRDVIIYDDVIMRDTDLDSIHYSYDKARQMQDGLHTAAHKFTSDKTSDQAVHDIYRYFIQATLDNASVEYDLFTQGLLHLADLDD